MNEAAVPIFRHALAAARPYVVGGVARPSAKLNQNESPFDLPASLKAELAEQFADVALNRYPSEQPAELVAAIADYLDVPTDHVLVSHGSNEFVHTLCLATIERGRRAVLPTPMFALFRDSVALFGGEVVSVPCRRDFSYDVDAIVAAVTEGVSLTVVACPCNPTGKDLGILEIERIVSAATGLVVIDEAYWEFTSRESAVSLVDSYPNLVVMRTLSKAFGLAAMRIGYAVAQPAVVAELMKARLPFMVDPFAQRVGLLVLREREGLLTRIPQILKAKAELSAALEAIDGVTVVPSDTNFLLFRAEGFVGDLQASLERAGVIVRSMRGYRELDGYLRVNAGTAAENQRFVDALKAAFI